MTEPTPAAPRPFVRIVTINFDGGDMTLACLQRLVALDWPADRREIVMVDNASVDGLARRVARLLPEVRIIDSLTNEGFARGNNLALDDLAGVDHVALVNNDALVPRDLLATLVPALEADPTLGAVSPKILFAEQAVEVEVRTTAVRSGRRDDRLRGVQLRGVRLDGVPARDGVDVDVDEGWHQPEPGHPDRRWSRAEATLRVWLEAGAAVPGTMALLLAAEEPRQVVLRSGPAEVAVEVGPEPRWVEVAVDPTPVDVVNNVGSVLYRDGSAGDRGFLTRDRGQFDEPAEVFAWCGAAVLLRGDYLRAVGIFDPAYFLYYEDTELSWRGRVLGWRYRTEPAVVVRHHHAASSVAGSTFFRFWVDRNRLLTLVELAPRRMLARALAEYLRITVHVAVGETWHPLTHGHRPVTPELSRRVRVLRSLAVAAPRARRRRRALRAERQVRDRELMAWAVAR